MIDGISDVDFDFDFDFDIKDCVRNFLCSKIE